MHICFLTHEYPKAGFPHGGIGSFLKTMAPELIKKGLKVSVVGVNYNGKEEYFNDNGVEVYRVRVKKIPGLMWLFNSLAVEKKVREIHKKTPISIIESSELGLSFVRKIKSVKYVIRLHGGHHFFAESENRKISKWKGFQEKLSFAKADAFIAVSQFVKNHTENYLSYHNKPVALLSNPINTGFFQPKQVEINENEIVFVGTVCEKKGIRQLIQAFPMVKEKFPKATLEIYGRDWFFPNGNSYMQMLKETELPKIGTCVSDVHFNGAIAYDEIPLKYAKAGVCVFPSHMETQGLVAPEAMAMEKTVIFTKYGPGPEAISEYETGLLCDPYSPEDIAQKICWVFSHQSESEIIGKKARQFVLEKYALEKTVRDNVAFYNNLLE